MAQSQEEKDRQKAAEEQAKLEQQRQEEADAAAKAAAEAQQKEAEERAASGQPVVVQLVQPNLQAEGAANIIEGRNLEMDVAKGDPYTSREGQQARGRYINSVGVEVDVDGRPIDEKK